MLTEYGFNINCGFNLVHVLGHCQGKPLWQTNGRPYSGQSSPKSKVARPYVHQIEGMV